MNYETIPIARNYFRTFDEGEKKDILLKAGEKIAYYIRDLEKYFTSDDRIEDIAQKLDLSAFVKDLRDIQIDYFIRLAELYKAGKRTKAIEILLMENNKLFQKVCSCITDDTTFEKELEWAVKLLNREKFMAAYKRSAEIEDLTPTLSAPQERAFAAHPLRMQETQEGGNGYFKYILIILALLGIAALIFYLIFR